MPDLTLYRDDIETLIARLTSSDLRLLAVLSDRLSQNLHPSRPASCDVCGRTAELHRVNRPEIETYACSDCIEDRPSLSEWVLQLNDYLENTRGFGTTSKNAAWYYNQSFTIEEAALDINRSYYAPDYNPDI
jgi:hypothetical protein